MIQIVAYKCNKCGNDIEPGTEKTLELLDRKNSEYIHQDGKLVVVPIALWEYCLCPSCFKEFNLSTSHPYEEN